VAKPRAVVFGYGDIGVRGTATLLGFGLEVPLVVTHQDDPNETRWYGSLYDFARERKLRVLADPPIGTLDVGQPDLIFSFYYRSMLPMSVLGRARLGAFNMHGSLLPKFRGRAPLNSRPIAGQLNQTAPAAASVAARATAAAIGISRRERGGPVRRRPLRTCVLTISSAARASPARW